MNLEYVDCGDYTMLRKSKTFGCHYLCVSTILREYAGDATSRKAENLF